jgi:hypothetical protein
MRVVIVRQFPPRGLGATGDHFQPHYRMPFALMSGRRDGPFLIDLAASHCLLILWLSAAPPASYADVGGCGIQNGNASSNHTSSATQSRLQRNSPRSAPKYANNARISRLFPDKPDRRERTARHRRCSLSWLFSGGHMRSPVLSKASGECNAIRRWEIRP